MTESTAEIVAQIGGEQATKGINLPLGDLLIGACALELGYAIGTSNVRDFNRIPGRDIIQLKQRTLPLPVDPPLCSSPSDPHPSPIHEFSPPSPKPNPAT